MGMVPEGPRLTGLEDVSEACPGRYRTLRYYFRTVHPGGVELDETVPVHGYGLCGECVNHVHYHCLAFVHDKRWSGQPSVDTNKRTVRCAVGGVSLSAVSGIAARLVGGKRNMLQFSNVVDEIRFSS